MFPQALIKHNIGNTIEFQNTLDIRAEAYLSEITSIGDVTIPVTNANDFTAGTILILLSSLGSDNAEIVVSSSHTNTALTVAATIQSHFRGNVAQQINYDQVVVQKSATIDGVYVSLLTQTLQVTQGNSIIYDAVGLSTDFYKLQWRNSITGAVSTLSDPFSVSSYDSESVGAMSRAVKLAMGIRESDLKVDDSFILSAMQDARNIVQTNLFGIRMPWLSEFEYPIKMLAGRNYVDLPSNIDFDSTDRSLLSARFVIPNISGPFPLRYVDKRSWNNLSYFLSGSTLASNITIGAITITLDNVGDFPSEGSVFIATNAHTETIMQVEYTSLDQTTNTLIGVTGVTRNVVAGTQAWVNPNQSQPIYYTVFEGRIYFDRIIPDIMQSNNLYIDFYKKMDQITSLYDIVPENYREMYKLYLRYAVKYRKDNDTSQDDADYRSFISLIQAVVSNVYTGQTQRIITS